MTTALTVQGLIDTRSQAGRSARGSAFAYGNTPGRAAGVPLPSPSLAPTTPRTTGIHIQIQPPTDPALSGVPSRGPSRTPSRAQRSRAEPSIAEEIERSVRAPSVAGTQRSRSQAREAVRSPTTPVQVVPPVPRLPRSPSPGPVPAPAAVVMEDLRTNQSSTASGVKPKKSKGKKGGKMGPVLVETKYSPSGHVESVTVKMEQDRASQRDSMYSEAPSELPPAGFKERRAPSTIAEEEIAMPIPVPARVQSPLVTGDPQGPWGPVAQEMRDKNRSVAGSARAPSVPPQSPRGDKPLHPLTNSLRNRAISPTPSQMTQQPLPMSPNRTGGHAREGAASPTHSQAGSRHTRMNSRDAFETRSIAEQLEALERMDNKTPTASRAQTPQPQKDMPRLSTKEAMDMIRTPRTSYSVSPSALGAEVNKSQHHDEELCVLLHAADDPELPDVVRKAVRKAVRSRLKKLGVDDEEQVCEVSTLSLTAD